MIKAELMFSKRIVVFLVVLLSTPLFTSGQFLNKSEKISGENPEIILNNVHDGGESGIQSRHIYIFIEEKQFILSNLQNIFDKYKTTYEKPYILTITVFSNRQMLQRLIDFEKQPITIEFSKDEEGEKASRKFYEQYYPLPKGYFRAEYHRYGNFEFFDYSPEKEDSKMIRVQQNSNLDNKVPSSSFP